MKNIKIITNMFICFLFLVFLVSCGCNKVYYQSYSSIKERLDNVYVSGIGQDAQNAREEKLIDLTHNDVIENFDKYKNSYIDAEKLTADNKTEIINQINATKTALNNKLAELKNGDLDVENHVLAISNAFNASINELNDVAQGYLSDISLDNSISMTNVEFQNAKYERIKNVTLVLYVVERAKEEVRTIVVDEKYKDYQVNLFKKDRELLYSKLDQVKTIIEKTDITTEKSYDDLVVERVDNVYKIMEEATSLIAKHVAQPEPIRFRLKSFGQFFTNFFDNFLVYPIGLMLVFFSKIFGGYYIFGLVITTLVIRTIGWPIYTKTNDMSLKMKLMEPEQAKIQEKYARRKDPESQKMMQMELMHLYKKYKIGFGGCLLPFLQFPIFMAVFRAIERFPYTDGQVGSPNWVAKINPNVFGIDLFGDRTGGTTQLIGILVLCVLVVGTQLLSQYIMNARQKQQQREAQADIPEYRRQVVNQANSMQSSMKIFMYMMTAMMAVFVFTSKAGLGVYWLIGNLYAIAQTIISSKTNAKRMEKLKQKHSTIGATRNKR